MARSHKSKNEIDKETMYKKIMPTSLRPMTDRPLQVPIEGERPELAPIAPDSGAAGKSIVLNADGININKERATILINLMERLVVDRLDGAFTKFKCCRCDKCKKDVAALALNKLPPKYAVVEPEKATELADALEGHEVSTAIVQAIIRVRANPRH